MSVKVNPHQKKVFEEGINRSIKMVLMTVEMMTMMMTTTNRTLIWKHKSHKLVKISKGKENFLSKIPKKNSSKYLHYFRNLEDLVFKLNDEDHSEDEGIEDYKIGGYYFYDVVTIPAMSVKF